MLALTNALEHQDKRNASRQDPSISHIINRIVRAGPIEMGRV